MRCQMLNENGERCKRKAIYKEKYFGDSELYESGKDYVLIFVCGHHLTTPKDSENFEGRINNEEEK